MALLQSVTQINAKRMIIFFVLSVFCSIFAITKSHATMKLVIMTQPTFFVEEDKILSALFDEGLECLHLRKPAASPMYSERLLSLLPDSACSRTVVHEHYYLKSEYRLAGIHLDDPQAPLPKDYRGKFSRTCTDINSLKEMKRKAEYVFMANVFAPISGQSEQSLLSHEDLERASSSGLIDRHVYALGGVNLNNIRIAKELGFGGVVVSDDLWSHFDIHNQLDYKELVAHFEKLKKAVS